MIIGSRVRKKKKKNIISGKIERDMEVNASKKVRSVLGAIKKRGTELDVGLIMMRRNGGNTQRSLYEGVIMARVNNFEDPC